MRVHIGPDDFLPTPPEFSDEEYARCKETGSVMPMVFEWYKWTGLAVNQVASLDPRSPGCRKLPQVHMATLRGLLNRCSRLMLAVLRLASSGKHGEATKLLNRSIAETATVVRWLCRENTPEAFERYLAEGLKSELKLKDDIQKNITELGGSKLVVEDRMVRAVDEMVSLAGMTEPQVRAAKPLLDLASLYRKLSLPDTAYIVVQRLGSHAVHGTWPDLLFHYLEQEDGEFVLRDNDVPADDTELANAAMFVLEGAADFATLLCVDAEFGVKLSQVMLDARDELVRLVNLKAPEDFSAV